MQTAPINNNHPMVIDHGITHTVTSINLNRVGWIKNICGFTEEYLGSFDLVDNQTYIDTKKADTPYEMTSDEWLLSYYVYVKDSKNQISYKEVNISNIDNVKPVIEKVECKQQDNGTFNLIIKEEK